MASDLESNPTLPKEAHTDHNDTPKSQQPSIINEKPTVTRGYDLPFWHKSIILFIVSWMTLAVTFNSTSLLPATPEIATRFNTTEELLNVINAGVLLAMGFSSLIWGPMSRLVGRRISYNIAVLVLCGCSAGTAAAINLPMFTAFRILGGLTGTSFMVMGQTILADIYEPVHPSSCCIGPCFGGIIVTFASWRIIFWVQVAMTGFGLILSLIFVPEIPSADAKIITTATATTTPTMKETTLRILAAFNPIHIVRLLIYPNIFLACITCGFLSTFQYAILTSARSIFNPRFHLTTALVSGLFYLAPGAGFLVGSILGGRLSDRTVRNYIKKRNGTRLPQDRLNSGLGTLFFVLPAAALVYGWTLQEEKGGMVVPIIAAFFGAFYSIYYCVVSIMAR
ncbi:MFS transporter [Aspergillus luchuensis IFO 4308]|nr:MFS transporter [Aspergillus luchuensis IFO 4308]